MGEIRKRGRIWWIRYCRGGRRYEESSRSDKYEAARDLLRVREGDIAKGAPVTSELSRFKFNDAATDIENDYTVNKRRSLSDLQRRIKLHLKPYFGGRRLGSITTADIRAYTRERLEAGASAGEINRELAALKRMFTLAIHAGKILLRPHIPMLVERNIRVGFFERDEFERLRQHLPESLRSVVTFAYLTGWRIPSEVLKLQWRQVDLKAGTVRLDPNSTKNRQGRLFPFGDYLPELRRVLEQQRRITTAIETDRKLICRWVFHRNGKPIKNFRKAWKDACSAAEVAGRIPHDFRRTAVRNLERAGVSRSVAMQLTGHLTESVYRRYAIVSEADLGAGVEKLAELANGTIRGTKARKGRVRRFRWKA
jgi:integrase